MTRDGKEDYKCVDCDITCRTCSDINKAHCDLCNPPLYPFKLSGTPFCFPDCGRGFYDQGDWTCARCDWPCADCNGDPKTCTSCFRENEFERDPLDPASEPVVTILDISYPFSEWKPYYLDNWCENQCPPGFLFNGDANANCLRCNDPCLNCQGSVDFCFDPDGREPCIEGMFYYNNYCYDPCPVGTAPKIIPIDLNGDGVAEFERSICVDCTGNHCSLCETNQPEFC